MLLTFEQLQKQVTKAATDHKLIMETINELKPIVIELYNKLDKDTTNLELYLRRGIRRDPYGKIPGIINKIVSAYTNPINTNTPWDAQTELDLQDEIIEFLNSKGLDITHDIILDIKEYKGFVTFIDGDYNLVEGEMPQFELLLNAYKDFAIAANLKVLDFQLTKDKWIALDKVARKRIQDELDAIKEAELLAKELQSLDEEDTTNEETLEV